MVRIYHTGTDLLSVQILSVPFTTTSLGQTTYLSCIFCSTTWRLELQYPGDIVFLSYGSYTVGSMGHRKCIGCSLLWRLAVNIHTQVAWTRVYLHSIDLVFWLFLMPCARFCGEPSACIPNGDDAQAQYQYHLPAAYQSCG